jgi:hypothetical protein
MAAFGRLPETEEIRYSHKVLELAEGKRMRCGHLKGKGYHTD